MVDNSEDVSTGGTGTEETNSTRRPDKVSEPKTLIERAHIYLGNVVGKMPPWIQVVVLVAVVGYLALTAVPDLISGVEHVARLVPRAVHGPVEPEILFATNRAFENGEPTDRTYSDIDGFYVGWADTRGGIIRTEVPASIQVDESAKVLVSTSPPFDRLFFKPLGEQCRAVIFLHDFLLDFDDAVGRGLLLKERLAPKSNWMVFSWPTARPEGNTKPSDVGRSTIAAEIRQRRMAEASSIALARFLLKSTDWYYSRSAELDYKCRISLVSEGASAFMLRGAVQSMRTFLGNNLPKMFDDVILIAPYEDGDSLTAPHKLAPLGSLSSRVEVYYNQSDDIITPLEKADIKILGHSGAERSGGLSNRITLIDVTPLEEVAPAARHGYATEDPIVVRDIAAVLEGDVRATDNWRRKAVDCNCFRLVR